VLASSRRQFLAWVAGLGVAGFVGHEWTPLFAGQSAPKTTTTPSSSPDQATTPAEAYDAAEARFFYSRPDLHPPRVTVVRGRGLQAALEDFGGYVLVAPKGYSGTGPGQAGLMVLQADGRLRWFLPTDKLPFDLQYQELNGQGALTWWEGDVTNGTGAGEAVIADLGFNELARIGEVDGLRPDLHELVLTDRGTALMTAYRTVAADLSAVGGPKKGFVYGGVALEVDVATHKVVHRWESVDHVSLGETYQKFTEGGTEKVPFDYFHINSITVAPDGDLLISARNTWAMYKVDRATGAVKWRLNGKKSDFAMGPGSRFYWQHHARYYGAGQVSLFDDGDSPAEEAQSRALVLSVDEEKMQVFLAKAFVHPARLLVPNQGSMQMLADGGAFVGWGAQPYFSRFSPEGELVVDARFPTNIQSYRAFNANFTARPTEKPAVAVEENPAGGKIVYVSWNGSTEVAAWKVLGGTRSTLSPLAVSSWADFETAISVNSSGQYFQVVAMDSEGHNLGSSDVVAA
jgi:Arylsulfotransferase (ASST)